MMDGRGHAIVARLPGDIAAWMPTSCLEVGITREYIDKIFVKHRLTARELDIVQHAIDKGWCIRPSDGKLDFLYVHNDGPSVRRFVVGIKSANHRRETWFQTLHRTDEEQVRRRLRQAKKSDCLIRAHLWD
jgi:hypothetical protein